MKKCVLIGLVFLSNHVLAHGKFRPTSSFIVSGEVKSPLTFSRNDLKKLTVSEVGDVVIINHLGEKKRVATKMKGVLLRDVLQAIEITAPSPKVLSEYYFVCKAIDGYLVVYSWNELFNSAVGTSACIVTEKAGQSIDQMDDSILMISPKDLKTGRRNLKSLTTIEVRRAQ